MRVKTQLSGGIVILLAGVLALLVWNSVKKQPDPSQPAPPAQQSSSRSRTSWQPDWSQYPGALVEVRMKSTVGVLLDDIPQMRRDEFARALLQKSDSFWLDRAERQIRLTSLRLSFRNGFYPKGTKWQLPLPPEELWDIRLQAIPQREAIEGHDVVTRDYEFSGILLTSAESPGISEPALKQIGGAWQEPFVFPVDPEFLFQRTGFACFNESQFPPNSVDAEEADLFYDHGCRVEAQLTNTGCHQTAMPAQSCTQALTAEIGSVTTAMTFTRLPWDARLADSVRRGTFTNPNGPDLEPYAEEFRNHRFTYRYIPAHSCTLEEQCVGGPGWRKLLMFPTADLNVGAKPLDIGLIDYFGKLGGSPLSEHGMFEFSACHDHYHFTHYGNFTLGNEANAISRKNGFCMQPTARLMNNELSPLHHPYVDCLDQGVAVGWIDEYKMGLECQWVDVTEVAGGQDLPLTFETNPDALICEGTLKRDAQGNQLFEPSTFRTSSGEPVDRPQCELYAQWDANNTESYVVHLPEAGESYVTGPCRGGLFGEKRNCGFRNTKLLRDCTPGTMVTLRCSVPADTSAQVVRVCEGSRALQTGIPCTYNDALASVVVGAQDITFTCPRARDAIETGGSYSFMTAPLIPEENSVEVTCTVE